MAEQQRADFVYRSFYIEHGQKPMGGREQEPTSTLAPAGARMIASMFAIMHAAHLGITPYD